MMHEIYARLGPYIAAYGSAFVFVLVMLETLGLPLPGETALISAAIYAGTTHRIDIFVLLFSAAAGAVVGGMIGYWIGRSAGHRLLLRYGARVGLTERRLRAGEYLFAHHGGKIIFFGRFFAVLRAFAALLAGANVMPWRRFLVVQIAACVMWAIIYGGTAYVFGKEIEHLAGPVTAAVVVVALLVGVGAMVLVHRHSHRLETLAAERAAMGRPVVNQADRSEP